MFGLLVSGRPLNHTPEVISQTQWAFKIPAQPSFSHVAVFLLPGNELPLEYGALIFVQLSGTDEFKLLGAITQNKQSAIFRINVGQQAPPGVEVTFGVAIEAAANVEAALASAGVGKEQQQSGGKALGSPVSTKVLAQRIIGNAFNFLASFGSDTIPLKAFQAWWEKFEKRIELDPGFLEREQGG